MSNDKDIDEMKPNDIRKKILDMTMKEGEGHIAGSFSCVEILITLYNKILSENDVFIMSKGHGCYALYVILREKGYNPTISGHPDIERDQGIACTTGSLGHGLPMAVGMALAGKLKKQTGKIYVLISDGECQAGTTWESLLIAAHHKLDNLVIIVDNNKFQALDKVDNILSLGNLKRKFESFGCIVNEVDGHNVDYIFSFLKLDIEDKPYIIIADTIKGKGVSFIENIPAWHAKFPTEKEFKIAYEELNHVEM